VPATQAVKGMEQWAASTSAALFHMSVQEKIQKLLWNKRYVEIPEDYKAMVGLDYVLILDMTLEDRNLYAFMRKMELESARRLGVPSETDLLAEARKVGLWTEEDDFILAKADEHIEFLESELKRQKFLARKKSLQLQIEETQAKKAATLGKKNEYFLNSADYYSYEVASYELIRRVVRKLDGTKVWSDDSSFLHFKQYHLPVLIFLVHEVMSENLMEISEIREVARSPEWRLTWTLQRENLTNVFDRKIGDLTLSQKLLIYWSRVYDSAFEGTEPPAIDIVNDDEKFDEWLSNRDLNRSEKSEVRASTKDHQERMQMLDGEYIEICNCGAKSKNVGKGLGERIMHTTTCPYGTFHRYTQDEREKIAKQTYSRNTDRVRTLIDQEQQSVIEKGIIEEHHLRGQKTRHIFGMKTDVVSTHK
jgi:hypothetical protein